MKPAAHLTAYLVATFAWLTAASASAQRFQQEAILIFDARTREQVWIADATPDRIVYYETERGVEAKAMPLDRPQAVFLVEPLPFTLARETFENGNYTEALDMFRQVRERYQKLEEIPGDHATLSAFYELECLRLMGDYAALQKAADGFPMKNRRSLTRKSQRDQLQLYSLWFMIDALNWDGLAKGLRAWTDQDLTGDLRAQVAYLQGRLHEQREEALDAINAYQSALVIDAGRPLALTRDAAQRALTLYLAQEAVTEGMREIDGDPKATPNPLLAEAVGLARFYAATLGDPDDLPGSVRTLVAYAPDEDAALPPPDDESENSSDSEAE